MAVSFDKPSALQRIAPIFQGFDGVLLGAVLLLAAIGVATATAGLLLFQYKMEIGQFIRKLRTQFTTAR